MIIFQNKKLIHKYLHSSFRDKSSKPLSFIVYLKKVIILQKKNIIRMQNGKFTFLNLLSVEHRGEKVSGSLFAEEKQFFIKSN